MKKRAKLLFDKSLDSLVLSIEHFNRPWDRGRKEAVLILLDRAFELLLKAAILHKGGKIREPYAKENIGFEKCVRKCLTDAQVQCLSETQGLTIQIINSLRDAAQHDLVELSEQELYMYSQAGVTLYRDLLRSVFNEELSSYLPARVLPISVNPPTGLHSMIELEFQQIKQLLRPDSRRIVEAKTKLKSLAIVEASLEGVRSQPSEFELRRLVSEIRTGKPWQDIFPGVASLELTAEGEGIQVDIRITKKDGDPVHLVKEGTPGATVLAVKRVNELDYYSLGLQQLAVKVNLTQPKALAVILHLGLQERLDCFKLVRVGKVEHKRYSFKAVQEILAALPELDLDKVWKAHRPQRRQGQRRVA